MVFILNLQAAFDRIIVKLWLIEKVRGICTPRSVKINIRKPFFFLLLRPIKISPEAYALTEAGFEFVCDFDSNELLREKLKTPSASLS